MVGVIGLACHESEYVYQSLKVNQLSRKNASWTHGTCVTLNEAEIMKPVSKAR